MRNEQVLEAQGVRVAEGQVVGLQLAALQGDQLSLESRVVAPAWRATHGGLGWADLRLLLNAASWALQQGARRCRFAAPSRNTAMQRLAREASAVALDVTEVFRMAVEN